MICGDMAARLPCLLQHVCHVHNRLSYTLCSMLHTVSSMVCSMRYWIGQRTTRGLQFVQYTHTVYNTCHAPYSMPRLASDKNCTAQATSIMLRAAKEMHMQRCTLTSRAGPKQIMKNNVFPSFNKPQHFLDASTRRASSHVHLRGAWCVARGSCTVSGMYVQVSAVGVGAPTDLPSLGRSKRAAKSDPKIMYVWCWPGKCCPDRCSRSEHVMIWLEDRNMKHSADGVTMPPMASLTPVRSIPVDSFRLWRGLCFPETVI